MTQYTDIINQVGFKTQLWSQYIQAVTHSCAHINVCVNVQFEIVNVNLLLVLISYLTNKYESSMDLFI